MTTEFNTLFETVTALAEHVDPVRLNQTLTATATALAGLGDRFGGSLVDGNRILDRLNPRMPLLRYDTTRLASLADVYADASPDLWDGLQSAVVTAHTVTDHRDDIDEALMAALGFGDEATGTFEQAGPYLVRGAADLLATTKLLDDYRGMIFCSIRNYSDVGPEIARVLAEGHPRAVAEPVPRDGHGVQHRRLQPRGDPATDVHRLRLGQADRRAVHQPVSLDLNGS